MPLRSLGVGSCLVGIACCGALSVASAAPPAPPPANYDESKVPAYTLPDPLVNLDGSPVKDAQAWREKRRGEILELFRANVYGRTPANTPRPVCEVASLDPQALGGRATRKQLTVYLTGRRDGPTMDLLVYLPNGQPGPVPAFLGLNFAGNHCVSTDPGITISKRWMRPSPENGVVDNRATEAARGSQATRWQVEKLIDRGYALATIYYGDLEPDHADGWKEGIRAALSPDGTNTVFKPDDWGAIGAWAWGLSRALDCLEQEPAIDARRVAVIGHSRLGKTSLWAGAQDERFAIVISNDSGEGGAALARRKFGERTANLTKSFPHWFCGKLRDYVGREETLPVDQHELLALACPRPVYVASATEDRWADPKGEFLALLAAEPVYRLFGLRGLGVSSMPPADSPVGDMLGYHLRTGKHDVTDYDWEQYLAFADRHFRYHAKPAN
jgi:hypothetical protein